LAGRNLFADNIPSAGRNLFAEPKQPPANIPTQREVLPSPMTPGTMAEITPKFGSVEEAAKAGVKTGVHYLRPTIEGVSSVGGYTMGSAIGAAGGAMTGPFSVGAVPLLAKTVGAAGGAAAYTASKGALDMLENWANQPPEIKQNPDMIKWKNAAEDFKMGLMFEFGGPTAMKIMGLFPNILFQSF